AVTMRMIKSTRTTSTRGVTLISVISPSSSPLRAPPAISGRSLAGERGLGVDEHLVAEGLHPGHAVLDEALEEVEEGDRGQGGRKADGRGDQGRAGLGHEAARHLTGALVELVEGADDADDGAEQADEGGVVADGAEE